MYVHTHVPFILLGTKNWRAMLLDVEDNVSLSWHSCNGVQCHGTREVWQSWDRGGMAVLSYIQYIP